MSRNKTIPEQIRKEEIQSYTYVIDQRVSVCIGAGVVGDDGVFVYDANQQFESIEIDKENFDALMSRNPSWNPSKQSWIFSKADLWVCVDYIRAGQDVPAGQREDHPEKP